MNKKQIFFKYALLILAQAFLAIGIGLLELLEEYVILFFIVSIACFLTSVLALKGRYTSKLYKCIFIPIQCILIIFYFIGIIVIIATMDEDYSLLLFINGLQAFYMFFTLKSDEDLKQLNIDNQKNDPYSNDKKQSMSLNNQYDNSMEGLKKKYKMATLVLICLAIFNFLMILLSIHLYNNRMGESAVFIFLSGSILFSVSIITLIVLSIKISYYMDVKEIKEKLINNELKNIFKE